ncbi:MAG: ribosome-binding factor A [Candidatus Dependentiae bacterium]|nr:ribosome-binding factor A [Candidatus Dependentiae bacterium]
MISKNVRNIRRVQKETQLLREISNLILQTSLDAPELKELYVNRVTLSPDRSRCYVYFATNGGKEVFDKKLGHLILYKPSMRTALANSLDLRYTPDLVFRYDQISEKERRIAELFTLISPDTTPVDHQSENQ